MSTIIKFQSVSFPASDVPVAYYAGLDGSEDFTAPIKRVKYTEGWDVVEMVSVGGQIYRKASDKKRGRPKKEQPAT
jgi:hypothetical protein